MKLLILFVILLFQFSLHSQSMECEELMEYVKDEGFKKGSLNNVDMKSSSWLEEVTAYEVEDIIVVIASIRKDEWGVNREDYIFCDIPSSNWDSFYYNLHESFGELFHKNIMDYRCNCN